MFFLVQELTQNLFAQMTQLPKYYLATCFFYKYNTKDQTVYIYFISIRMYGFVFLQNILTRKWIQTEERKIYLIN